MKENLTAVRCFLHARREAVARCPDCAKYYCRECITEHGGKVICASCLATLEGASRKETRRPGFVWPALQGAAGLLLLWLIFYGLGRALMLLPSEFHEGALWMAP